MTFPSDGTTGETTSHLTKAASCQAIGYSQSTKPAVRGCCRFIGFTTTAYPLRVRGQVAGYPACGRGGDGRLREFRIPAHAAVFFTRFTCAAAVPLLNRPAAISAFDSAKAASSSHSRRW